MKVFLDTNVLIDATCPDREHHLEAQRILSIPKDLSFQLCTSVLSVANYAYVLRRLVGKDSAMDCLRTIVNSCKILSMNDMQLFFALESKSPDFEDALQIACADIEGCDCIVSGNSKHFRPYTCIPIYNSVEFLQKLQSSAEKKNRKRAKDN